MKYRYYVGDPDIPWWVEELIEKKLIIEVRENAAITFFLTFKHGFDDTRLHYLYDGDFLELNEDTGAVTIGYNDWDTALSEFFKKSDWDTMVESIQKSSKSKKQKEKNEQARFINYWS